MDPKKQAEIFYKSLIAADHVSCGLLHRSASVQLGRVTALERKLAALTQQNAPADQLAMVQAEIDKRTALAEKYIALDNVVVTAIEQRATLDKNKFK